MESIEDIKKVNMMLHGFDVNSKPLEIDTEFSEFSYLLSKIDLPHLELKLKGISKWKMKRDARTYLKSKLSIRDVRFSTEKMYYKLGGKTVGSVAELAELYNSVSKYVSPFHIPIVYRNYGQFYGLLVFHEGIYDTLEFYKNMLLSITSIELPSIVNDITTSCYIHEIVHTQLIDPRGKIRDYNNGEVLSMFMELIYLLEKDSSEGLLKESEINKINYFLLEFDNIFKFYYENDGSITEYETLKSSKYANSILKALKLFQIYYYGNTGIKKEILIYLQKVIDGCIILEDMLEHFEITHESSIDGSLYKYLLRK